MRKIVILCLTLCASVNLWAQSGYEPSKVNSSDVRARIDGAFEWEPVKNLSFEAGLQLRLKDNLAAVDRFQTTLGVGYDVCKYFKVGADYILINSRDNGAGVWEKPRHRMNINLEGSVTFGDLKLSLRERLQTTFRTDEVNRYEKPKNELVLRSRLMAAYRISGTMWTPYLLFELHNTLNAPKVVGNCLTEPFAYDNYVTRYRAGVGAKLRVTRNHRLDFYYYFDYNRSYDIDYKKSSGALKGYVEENQSRHTIGISYKFKL